MKILMLSPVDPFPSNTGSLVRIAKIYTGLCQYHNVTLICPTAQFDCNQRNIKSVEAPQHTAWHKVAALLSIKPYHQYLYYEPLMHKEVRLFLSIEKFDLIYAHFIYTLPYVTDVKSIPIIVDQHNVDWQYWKNKSNAASASFVYRMICRINQRKVIHFEQKMQEYLTGYVSVSSQDREFTKQYSKKTIKYFILAPNGVDTKHYQQKQYINAPDKITIGFLGSLDIEINQFAVERLCQRILPLVRATLSHLAVSVLLIGRNPPFWLRNKFKADRSIIFSGTVNDVHPYLREIDILCLPLNQGAGSKLRVLEAMSVGLPIVGNSFAFIGIDGIVDGKNVMFASEDYSFASRICQLSMDADARLTMGHEAHELVSRSYDWAMITNKLSQDLEAIKSSRKNSV